MFEEKGKEHRVERTNFRGNTSESKRKWIDAHATDDIEADFNGEYEGEEVKELECWFTIYHTHGAKTVDSVSYIKKND